MIPALLVRDGQPYLAFGSMGGEGQPQSQAALVTRIVDFGYDVQQAIEAPRWLMGRTWGTRTRNMSLEGRISDEVVRELKRRGSRFRWSPTGTTTWGTLTRFASIANSVSLRVGRIRDGAALGY